jgi:hypothetical protein
LLHASVACDLSDNIFFPFQHNDTASQRFPLANGKSLACLHTNINLTYEARTCMFISIVCECFNRV